MARDVWPKCENPIVSHSGIEPFRSQEGLLPTHVEPCPGQHAALLGVAICDKMAEVAVHENASAAERAQTMQAWAVGALDMAVDEEQAHAVLLRSIHGDQEHFQHSALDLAVGIKAKTFLAQRHCLSLTAKMWLQSTADGPVIVLPDDLPYWRLVLYTVLPPINPFLWPQPTSEDHDMASLGTEEALHDVHTRGASMAFAISSEERKHVHPGDKSSLVRQVSRIERQASQQLKLNHVRKDDPMEGVTLSTMMRVFYSIPAGPLLLVHFTAHTAMHTKPHVHICRRSQICLALPLPARPVLPVYVPCIHGSGPRRV